MEVAATGIFQVAEVKLKHLLLQLAEVDAGFLDESFVDLLDLLCNGGGPKQRKQLQQCSLRPYLSLSTSFNPQNPKLREPFPEPTQGKDIWMRMASLGKEKRILTGNKAM